MRRSPSEGVERAFVLYTNKRGRETRAEARDRTERPAPGKQRRKTLTYQRGQRYDSSHPTRLARPRPRYCSRNEHSRPSNLCIRGRSRQRPCMRMTFRWFGPTDPIPLAYIRQIPGVDGVVSALYDIPVGDAWPRSRSSGWPNRSTRRASRSPSSRASRSTRTSSSGGRRATGSSTPGARAWPTSARSASRSSATTSCPSSTGCEATWRCALPDGSTALAFDDDELARVDLSRGTRRPARLGRGLRRRRASRARRRVSVDDRRAAVGESGLSSSSASFPPPEAPASASRSIPTTRRGASSVCRAS